ncbi:hypothetical protein [Marinobacter sp. CHS3-4]|uniref:hypothetical protein n=1 Tax=Marinobacter sp. CHS3-4 TaxID=3045174 RepID=UPI0024B5DDB8|nr:hypothetical protein [Marinobacter sp. CHS3-4]MDI9245954.1 hypothetical protein [Marinobacter sp. CHS3-4]
MNRTFKGLSAALLFTITSLLSANALAANFEKVAVMVFPQNEAAERFANNAQSHLEMILLDNGITVLDKDEAEALKNGWTQLEDPGALITAEDFVENADKYAIDGILRIYLNLDVLPSIANSYSATAQADIRFVDEQANVEAAVTNPMGTRGNPPSDGLSPSSASINAIYRALEEAAQAVNLDVFGKTQPRAFKYKLTETTDTPKMAMKALNRPTDKHEGKVELFDSTWKWEDASCASESPNGNMIAVAGYVTETGSGMSRSWYSRLHIYDVVNEETPYVFDAWPKGTKPKRLGGTSQFLDCGFMGSWRFAVAMSGNYVFLWDTERGIEMSKHPHNFEFDRGDEPRLKMGGGDKETYLSVEDEDGEEARYYKVEVAE